MSEPSYQEGNTVKLTAKFKDWDGQLVDPTLVKVLIYDSNYKKLDEHSIGPANRIDTGIYYYDYITQSAGTYFYEWYAEIDGLPSLKRATLKVRKI